MHKIPVKNLERTVPLRPPGYLEDVLSQARVEDGMAYFEDDVLQALLAKYREYRTSLPLPPAVPQQTHFGPVGMVPQVPPFRRSGVGAELKKLLKKVGIVPEPNCACNRRAAIMDNNGPEWCEENMATILAWLKEEATRRKLPFIEAGAKLMVKRAIHNFRKSTRQKAQEG